MIRLSGYNWENVGSNPQFLWDSGGKFIRHFLLTSPTELRERRFEVLKKKMWDINQGKLLLCIFYFHFTWLKCWRTKVFKHCTYSLPFKIKGLLLQNMAKQASSVFLWYVYGLGSQHAQRRLTSFATTCTIERKQTIQVSVIQHVCDSKILGLKMLYDDNNRECFCCSILLFCRKF